MWSPDHAQSHIGARGGQLRPAAGQLAGKLPAGCRQLPASAARLRRIALRWGSRGSPEEVPKGASRGSLRAPGPPLGAPLKPPVGSPSLLSVVPDEVISEDLVHRYRIGSICWELIAPRRSISLYRIIHPSMPKRVGHRERVGLPINLSDGPPGLSSGGDIRIK